MTLSELMTIALRRCGLTASSSTYTQNSYKYLDVTSAMLMGESSNWYFRRKKGTITTSASDPDYSETGTVTDLIIGGINTSTSTIQVLAYPIPDSVQSIQYWYNQAFPEMGTSLDSTDLHKYCPRWFQNCLLFSLSAMFYSEKGDMQGAGTEFELMQKNLRIGFSVQSQINGDTTPRLGRKGYVNQSAVDQFTFDVREGSLS